MDSVIQFRGTIYENGYGLLAQKVMRDKTLPKQSKLIYAYMCSFASINTENGERTAFPSVSLQCDELDMGEDTYYRWRKYLVDRGLITIEKRKTAGKFDRNIYYIEAVPVPQDTNTEPYPKKSGTVKPSKVNKGTIINSLNSNNSNNNKDIQSNDDDIGEKSPVNPIHAAAANPKIENEVETPTANEPVIISDLEMKKIITSLREETKVDLIDRSFNAIVKKVVDKHKQGKVNSFRDYLMTALQKKIEELEGQRVKNEILENASKQTNNPTPTTNRPVSFYNWLEERED